MVVVVVVAMPVGFVGMPVVVVWMLVVVMAIPVVVVMVRVIDSGDHNDSEDDGADGNVSRRSSWWM